MAAKAYSLSPIFQKLRNRHKYDAGYQRRYGNNYIDTRQKIENSLRRLFIERSGKPIRKYPLYFVLGESIWLKNLAKEPSEVKMRICDLNPATTSLTFPDSYIALSNNRKPYPGKVFLPQKTDWPSHSLTVINFPTPLPNLLRLASALGLALLTSDPRNSWAHHGVWA